MLRIGGLREYDVAFLNMPAQDDLHIVFPVLFRKLCKHRLIQKPLVAVADGVPAFDCRAIRRKPLLQGVLLVIRMALYLKHRRLDLCRADQLLQTLRFKIADADGFYLSLGHGFLHILPCAKVVPELLMQKKQIDIFGVQPFQHFVNGRLCFALAVFAWPEL